MLRWIVVSIVSILPLACVDSPPREADGFGFAVTARAETAAIEGDPDDAAIWIAPGDPGESLIVAADKAGGLQLYELDGRLRQDARDGAMNNVDLRMDVPLGGALGTAALIASSNRSKHGVDLYSIDANTRMLVRIGGFASDIGEPYGLCMLRSPADARVYVIINDKQGALAQYEVALDEPGVPRLRLARIVRFGGQLEGCVADDELGRLYVGEEQRGIWRLDAEPDADARARLIHAVEQPYLRADVEGLTLYEAADGEGYLIASSQGSSSYAVFERGGENAYLTSFRIVDGEIDGTRETDGVAVSARGLGPLWPDGLFIAHDDDNGDGTRNLKLVGWGDIVAAADVELLVATADL